MVDVFLDSARAISDLRSILNFIVDYLLDSEYNTSNAYFLATSELEVVLNLAHLHVLDDEPKPIQIFFVLILLVALLMPAQLGGVVT